MIKWAIQNGNWSAGTTWNDGVVPVDGDYVYANSYNVSIDTNINIGNGTLTNGVNPNTNLFGGSFVYTANRIITANIDGYDYSHCVMRNYNQSEYSVLINGNITAHNTQYYSVLNFGNTTINGNLYGSYCVQHFVYLNGSSGTLTINGSIYGDETKLIIYMNRLQNATGGFNRLVINGNTHNAIVNYDTKCNVRYLYINGNVTNSNFPIVDKKMNNLTILGNLVNTPFTPKVIEAENFTIGGNITYNKDFGVNATNTYYENIGQTQYISQSETPFIIINNTDGLQYPLPENVKKNVVYASGNYTGQLEPVTVDATNTINVYPYKKRQ